jgi:hypothetical protein
MKCLKCKLEIPSNAEVCGHCGHPTAEQRRHRGLFILSCIIVLVPTLILGALLKVYDGKNVLWWAFAPWFVVALVFKFVFKGEFSKTGFW